MSAHIATSFTTYAQVSAIKEPPLSLLVHSNMRTIFIITAVLAAAAVCAASPALDQSAVESELGKLTNQVEAEQYYDSTNEVEEDAEKLSMAQVQELKDVLEDLLHQTNALSTEGMSAEMQGFWNVLKRGLGSAFRIAHRGVGFFNRNIAPLLVQQPGQLPGQQYPMPPSYRPMQYQPRQYQPRTTPPRRTPPRRTRPRKTRRHRGRSRGRRTRGRRGRGRHEVQMEQLDGNYKIEQQVLSALQQYEDGGIGSKQQYDDEGWGSKQQYDDEERGSKQQYDDEMWGSKQQYDDEMWGSKQQYNDEGWGSKQQYDDEGLGSKQQYDIYDKLSSIQQYDNDEMPGVAKAQFFRILGGLLKKLFG